MRPKEQIKAALRTTEGKTGFILIIAGVLGVIAMYVFDPNQTLSPFLVFLLGMVTVVGTRMFTTSLTEVRAQNEKKKKGA